MLREIAGEGVQVGEGIDFGGPGLFAIFFFGWDGKCNGWGGGGCGRGVGEEGGDCGDSFQKELVPCAGGVVEGGGEVGLFDHSCFFVSLGREGEMV